MSIISVLGVAIGVGALVIVLSVMGGFENDLKKKMFRGLPHLEIMSKNETAGMSLDEFSVADVRNIYPAATGVEPFTQADVILKAGKHIAPVTLFGIDPNEGGKLWGFSNSMVYGNMNEILEDNQKNHPKVILGENLAIYLGVGYGDEIQILSPQSGINHILAGGSLSATYKVGGIFATDLPRYDERYAVVSINQGRKFLADYDPSLDDENYVTGIAVNLPDPEDVEVFSSRLKDFPGLQIQTWKNVNKSLLFALKLEKFTMGSILLLIVLVAAFSISGTMMMTVHHKKNQIALLCAIGMSQKAIGKLYLMQGFMIGLIGSLIGLGLGLCVCTWLSLSEYINLPAGLYYQSKLPVKFLPVEYLVICLSAWVLSLIAATYPAMMAAKQNPGVGLRYT